MRGSVRGCVVLAANGMPVPDARIELVRSDGTQPDIRPWTDSGGWFQLDALLPGSWMLSAAGPAGEIGSAITEVFDNALSDVTIEVAASHPEPERSTRGDSDAPAKSNDDPLPLAGSLRGRVVRGDGSPVASATITVVHGDGTLADIAPLTDVAGWFVLEGLMAGKWVLHALGPAGEKGDATVNVFDNAHSEATIEVGAVPVRPPRRNSAARTASKMERDMPGSVHGRVEQADGGKPVPDATIAVVKGAGPAPDIAPLTNAQGRFALDGLPAGEWVLAALTPTGETGEVTVRVSRGAVTEAVIRVYRPDQQ